MTQHFPFSAMVGQSEMTTALLLAAVDPGIGGVLIMGDRGTGKSTAVRALAQLLPPITVADGCAYNNPPGDPSCALAGCTHSLAPNARTRKIAAPVIDLPLGVTEDRVLGALDLEAALTRGEKRFEPGLMAAANRGFLYIDEVNLLEDHLVDLLLDAAASGENVVEREGLSIRHPCRFVLIGSGNPEEGDLRPQLLDRFGLSVDVSTTGDIKTRIEIIRRREAFERDRAGFADSYKRKEGRLRGRVNRARAALEQITVPDAALEDAARLCMALGTDGLRGELTLIRAARALAALDGKDAVSRTELKLMAIPALAHRLRRDPLDDADGATRLGRVLEQLWGV